MKVSIFLLCVMFVISCSSKPARRTASLMDASLEAELGPCEAPQDIVLRGIDEQYGLTSFSSGRLQSGWTSEGQSAFGYKVLIIDSPKVYFIKNEKCFSLNINDSLPFKETTENFTNFTQVLKASELKHKNLALGDIEESTGNFNEFDQYEQDAAKIFELSSSRQKIFLAKDKTGYEFVGLVERDSDGEILIWYQKHWRHPKTLETELKKANINLPKGKIPNNIEAYNVISARGENYFIYRIAGKLQVPILLSQ